MKSLFLTGIKKPDLLTSALTQVLPAQGPTWLLLSAAGDPIAYFSVVPGEEALEVQADISGRHYHEDDAVTAVLMKIAAVVGGSIRKDE